MLPYALRHYATFCGKMIVHDGFSTDRTRELAVTGGAEVVDWDTGGKFDDEKAMRLKSTTWKDSSADWIIFVDADELVYFPLGAVETLSVYEKSGIGLPKPVGYEMLSDTMPEKNGQIYDEVKYGARCDNWYGKPAIVCRNLMQSVVYSAGAHTCEATMKSGKSVKIWYDTAPSEPPCLLLHFHQIGPIERIAARYDAALARQSKANLEHGWGNRTPSIKHAQDKRAFIQKDIQRVIP